MDTLRTIVTASKAGMDRDFKKIRLLLVIQAIVLLPFAVNATTKQDTSPANNKLHIASNISPALYSNGRLISVNITNVSIDKGLNIIADKARLGISINADIIPDKKVSLNIDNVTVYSALSYLLRGTNLEAVLNNDRDVIVIKQQQIPQVQETVTGKVVDADNGQALPGVNILVVGSSSGTSSDEQGNFELEVESLQDTLRFSYIGYQTKEVPLNGQSDIEVQLSSQTLTGQEVVVVGYGTQEEADVTGSVSSVKSEELMERPAINVEQTLAGKVAGVNVSTNSGRPGGRTRIRIRGYGSINASNDPLYVVDGVVLNSGISTLNPNNIESIEVLKDASATAIYGTRVQTV